jgi:hypothetical protein
MTNRDDFEIFCRTVRGLDGPFLRECGEIDAGREYQDFGTQALWEQWQARQPEIDALRAALEQAGDAIIANESLIMPLRQKLKKEPDREKSLQWIKVVRNKNAETLTKINAILGKE